MGFHFRRRIKLFPGVRLNIGKKGLGVTLGPRGTSVSVGPSGVYVNKSIRGTGVSYRQKLSLGSSAAAGPTRAPLEAESKAAPAQGFAQQFGDDAVTGGIAGQMMELLGSALIARSGQNAKQRSPFADPRKEVLRHQTADLLTRYGDGGQCPTSCYSGSLPVVPVLVVALRSRR